MNHGLFHRAAFVVTLFCAGVASGLNYETPPIPTDPRGVELSLLTVGIGEELYTRYGHTMIRVQDPAQNLDYVVNWGIFDYTDPYFVPKFFRGILIYWMGFFPYNATLRLYGRYEMRPVWEDKLNLTDQQKAKLLQKIAWNAQPENMHYPYHYFYNNCSTIPRDYLDEALDGAIKKRFFSQGTSHTYRDYVRQYLASSPLVSWGLDILFNSANDHEITAWAEMFMPLKLRDDLLAMPALDDQGNPRGNEMLLTGGHQVVDAPGGTTGQRDWYWYGGILWGMTLLLGAAPHFLGKSFPAALVAPVTRLFGFGLAVWGLLVGTIGLIHPLAWAFSAHTDLHHNANFWIFWPTDLVWLWVGLCLLFKGRVPHAFAKRIAWQKYYFTCHLVCGVILAILWMSGVVIQDVSRVLAIMVPLMLGFYLTCFFLSLERKR